MQTVHPTYAAVFHNNQLQWEGDVPPELVTDRPMRVHVTVLTEAPTETEKKERGRRMAEALETIAKKGGLGAIPDPSHWQQEVRQDRPLPGREA